MGSATSAFANLTSIYGERLLALYLFGSYARGEARPDSDLDVLIILDDIPSYSDEVDQTNELVARISLDSGISYWCRRLPGGFRPPPFLENVCEEAIVAWEETRKLLDKAAHALHAARVLRENEEAALSAGRATRSSTWAEALLWEDGRRSKSHSGAVGSSPRPDGSIPSTIAG